MATERTLPIFPLSLVLFPDAGLPLRIFEPRYLRMVSECMRADQGFVVSLIRAGREAGEAAQFHEVGTLARIEHWEQGGDGMLHLLVRGETRVQVVEYSVAPDQLITGRVVPLEPEAVLPIAEQFAPLVALVEKAFYEHGLELPEPGKLQDATWVGCRLAELLPIPMQRRQWLLELTNPQLRLEALAQIAEGTPDARDTGSRGLH